MANEQLLKSVRIVQPDPRVSQELEKDIISHNLFVKYDTVNKHRLNMFWCREWGYSGVDCDKFKIILNKVDERIIKLENIMLHN